MCVCVGGGNIETGPRGVTWVVTNPTQEIGYIASA